MTPDGRFVPRWSGLLALVWLAGLPVTLFLTGNSLGEPYSGLSTVLPSLAPHELQATPYDLVGVT